MMGRNHADLGHHADAIEYLRSAVRSEPRRIRFHMTLAKEYERVGRWQEAENVYRQVIRLAPRETAGYSSLAYLLIQNREVRKARQVLIDWGHWDPDNPTYLDLVEAVQRYFND